VDGVEDADTVADADLKNEKKQTKIETRSGCATSPSLGGGKEALDDKAADEARATVSRRRSSIAMRFTSVGVGEGGVGVEEKKTRCRFFSSATEVIRYVNQLTCSDDGHLVD
jgi:hypothetical protein